ncbi:hypothetical protein JZM24_00170 [Candidatus Sodalis endolongispinus]|uniref:Uncharacterized protein n=1 Tax=Candidatus Sodalis endolongispinus TaxID=2812662 RepID=A0ABS5Y7M0_9GAMM|nr:hypothetical protein [Candidatus Sodalis endolongispinus]MBT9430984.1 hypothetical protein [Candidatus Sodalis endolongispinus]
MEKSINHEELDMTFSTRLRNKNFNYKQDEMPTMCDLLSAIKLRVPAIPIQPESKKLEEGDVLYLHYTGKDEGNRNFFNIIYAANSDALAFNIFIAEDGLAYYNNEVFELKYINGDFILNCCAIALRSPKKNKTTCDSFSSVDKKLFPVTIYPEAKRDVDDGDIFSCNIVGKKVQVVMFSIL